MLTTFGRRLVMNHRPPLQCRTMFSDSYLSIDRYKKKRNIARLQIPDEAAFKARITGHFSESGNIQNIFREDIVKLLDIAETDSDLKFIYKLLAATVENNRKLPYFGQLVNMYISTCKIYNNLDRAVEMYQNESIHKWGGFSTNNIRLRYLIMLYQAEMYQDVLKVVRQLDPVSVNDEVLAMASLYHIGTKEAFEEATAIEEARKGHGRTTCIFALFAHKQGHSGLAYDTLAESARRNLSTNLKLMILTDVNRLEDALSLIKYELLPEDYMQKAQGVGYHKRFICFDVMRKLTTEIKNRSNPELVQEFTRLCQMLDENVELLEKTIEEMVFQPIQPSVPRLKSKSQQRDEEDIQRRSRRRKERDAQERNNEDHDDDDHHSDISEFR